jgi:hypothetical protein
MKHKNAKIVLAVSLSLVLCSAAVPKKAVYQKKAEEFLTGVLKGEVEKSYDEIFPKWVVEAKPQQIQMVKMQTTSVINMHGKLLDYEFIKQQKYGDSVVRLVYVLKSKRMPFTWEFYFYKPVSDWHLVNIQFNDEFDLLANK